MRTTQSIQFYCRKSKSNKQGLAPVELSIDINGERKFINLPFKCSPLEFGYKRQPKYISDYLDTMRVKVYEIVTDMARQNIPLTAERLREYIRTGGIKSYTIEDLFTEYLDILRLRIGKDLTKGVYRKYEWVRDLFMEHMDFGKECSAITNAIIRSFYAKLNAKYDLSTSAGYMTKLKSVIRFGMDNDRISTNPFQGIKINKGRKEIEYLTEEEIGTLCEARLENESLQHVLDLFLIMAGTGLSYIDLRNLNKDDIQEYNGTYYIKKNRVKTNVEYTAVVLPFAVDIFNRYEDLHVISNQKLNTYLHTIERLIGFPKSLRCHLARHTYATMLLNRHVSIETVSKSLGHNNIKITQSNYARLLDKTVITEISSVF